MKGISLRDYMAKETDNFTSPKFLAYMEEFRKEDELRESVKNKIAQSSENIY